MICERCQGLGKYKIIDNKKWGWYIAEKCYLCDGQGETDWITEVFNEKQTKCPTRKKLYRDPNRYINSLQRVYPTKEISIIYYAFNSFEQEVGGTTYYWTS